MKTAELPPPPRVVETPKPVQPIPTAKKGRSSWWVYLILFLVVGGFGYFIYTRLIAAKASGDAATQKRNAVHPLPVVVATSRRGDLDQYLIGLGTVTPLKTVTVKSRVDGAITKIAFEEGQLVHEGDLLIEIDPRPYEATLKQAQGQLAKDKAALDSAEWTVKADQEAIKDKGITEQQLHVDTATRDQDAGAIEIDQANIDAAQLNLTYSHITSPITGRIGLRLVDLGNIVHASDTTGLAVITQLQPITVVFTLPEDNIAQIQKRMAEGGPLVVDAYDRDLTQKIASGTLLAIDNMIDPSTGTVKIKAQFDDKQNELFPSQFVNARLLVNTIRGAVLVPSAAIQHSPASTFVYVVTADPPKADSASADTKKTGATTRGSGGGGGIPGTVAVREVTVGASQAAVGSDGEDTTVVLRGIGPGETVVTDGVDKLQDGSKVLARPSARKAATRPAATQESSTTQPTHRRRRPQNNE
jgi:multidrug efflux system membrane fusion protein